MISKTVICVGHDCGRLWHLIDKYMMQTLKRTLRRTLKHLPFKAQLISVEATFPPALKTNTMMRVASAIAEYCPQEMIIHTNLGITTSYDLMFSNDSNELLLFGRPEYYVGERAALRLTQELTKLSTAFVDIGAHKGYYVFYVYEGNPDKPIYFIEPHPQLFNDLENNIERNQLKQVMGLKTAIGAELGNTQFYLDITSPLQGSLKEYTHQDHEVVIVDVEIITFDHFIKTYKLTDLCVKVDIENAEFDFLNGAKQSLTHISYLVMEVLSRAVGAGFVKTMIEEFSFHAYYINDFSLEYTIDGNFTYVDSQYNWLFCRLSPTELEGKLIDTPFTIVAK